MTLDDKLKAFHPSFEAYLSAQLDTVDFPSLWLRDATYYAVLNGGKRLRPYLVACVANMLGVSEKVALVLAGSIEIIHCYTLVHDDLPSMDNADTRRGKPSCHRQFNEATAILVGDGLIPLAYQWLVDISPTPDVLYAFSKAVGMEGVVGGQMLDIKATPHQTLEDVIKLQSLKTGALFKLCCTAPALMAGVDSSVRQALASYGDRLGLLFQLTDDILDVEGSNADYGKPLQQDTDKATFVTLLGMDGAKNKRNQIIEEALHDLEALPFDTKDLAAIVRFAASRVY